ncbi:hypothetical protein FRC02_000707 [Tulasnella sp. 418]|nr:hypothetical protein FRC02_000707 [Tulasnella sp. 418]
MPKKLREEVLINKQRTAGIGLEQVSSFAPLASNASPPSSSTSSLSQYSNFSLPAPGPSLPSPSSISTGSNFPVTSAGPVPSNSSYPIPALDTTFDGLPFAISGAISSTQNLEGLGYWDSLDPLLSLAPTSPTLGYLDPLLSLAPTSPTLGYLDPLLSLAPTSSTLGYSTTPTTLANANALDRLTLKRTREDDVGVESSEKRRKVGPVGEEFAQDQNRGWSEPEDGDRDPGLVASVVLNEELSGAKNAADAGGVHQFDWSTPLEFLEELQSASAAY